MSDISITVGSAPNIDVEVSAATSVDVVSAAATSVSVTEKGPKGDTGETGPQGIQGETGPAGADGEGLIAGGSENQFIQKNSATDYDTKWSAYTLPAADGTDRQVLMTDGAGTVSFAYPQTIAENVKNVSGGPLYKGTPVHVTGSVGNLAEVIAADAATNYPAHFVLDEDLADEGEGKGIALGFINNVDVPNASIYTEGQTVYLGASGGWTTTKPTGTNAIQNLGVIIKVNVSGNKISGIIMGAGRANDVPNIPDGQAWIGNASGVATPTTLADVATSGAYSDLSGTPSIPVSGVDFDPVGTDNSTDVTLAGAYNYLTLAGQEITLGQVDYTTDVSNTPTIPTSGVDFDPVGTDNSTDVTLAGIYDYIRISGQTLLLNQVDYNTDIANTPTIPSGDLVDDTTPQLGGDLDVNGQSIVSVSSGDITLAPDGTGIVDIQGQLQAASANFPVLGFDRATAITGGSFNGTTGIASAMLLTTTSSGNMTDGFGGGIVFNLNDNTVSGANYVARIYTRRDGADNKGALQFFTGATGITPSMTLRASGNVGIGETSPDTALHVSGQIKVDDGVNPYTLPAADGTANYVLQTNGSGVVGWVALPASGVDFDPVGTDNSTDVSINANATDVLRMNAGQILGSQDAGADKLVFWDDSEGKLTYATIGTNLTMTGDTLSASGGGGGTITALNNQAENRLTTIGATTTELDGEANLTFDGTTLTVSGEVRAEQIYVNARFPVSPANGYFSEGARLGRGFFTSGAITAGALYILGASSWTLADADAASTGSGLLVVATDAGSAAEVVLEGAVKLGSNTGFSGASRGDLLYLSTTGGEVTTTAPSATGDIVRVVGYVIDATNAQIYFNPDNTWLEI